MSDFRDVVGNLKLLLLMIAGSWTLAALGEELVWRGYLLNRVADLFGRGRWGWMTSLALGSIIFGLAHSYQDTTGVVENTVAGLLLGGLYLACGRNLLAPIVAHGITDTVDSLLIFSGLAWNVVAADTHTADSRSGGVRKHRRTVRGLTLRTVRGVLEVRVQD